MVIVERSSSGVSRSGPRRIVMHIVFGLAVALTLVSARAEPLPRTVLGSSAEHRDQPDAQPDPGWHY